MTQTWNPAQNDSAHNTLSGGNLICTHTGTDAFAPCYGTEGFTTGKFYWETTLSGSTGATPGFGNTSTSVADGQYNGIGADSVGVYSTGKIWNNNAASAATYATWANGNLPLLVCHAYDIGNALYWYRLGASGLWLNDVIGNQNPATGTGGYSVNAGVVAHPIVPGCTTFTATTPDAVTAAFAQASWAGSAPAGFGPFDPTTTVLLPYVETWS